MFKIAVIAIKHPTEPNLYLHGLRRDNSKWALAGGHFNDGETDFEAASRELEEETGLKGVKLNKLANEKFGDNDVHLFHCDCPQDFVPNSQEDPDSEFISFKWLDPTAHDNLHVPARKNILIRHLMGTLNKSEIQITVSDEELGTLEKTAPRFKGDLHPNQPWIAMQHPSGNIMWHANQEQASKLDRTISNPELIQNFLNKIPESHRNAAHAVIKMIQKDPNRHFIPTEESGSQKLRARHIKSLIYDNPDVKMDTSTPGILKITRASHSQQQRHPDITVSYKFGGQSGKVAKNERPGAFGLSSDIQLGTRAESSIYTDGNGIYFEQSEGFITRKDRTGRNSGLSKKEINNIFRNGLKKSDGQSLIHYSSQSGLKEIHPEKMGTGVKGLQYKRGIPENKSSFFYTEDSEPEQMVTQGAQSKYTVKMPSNVYDFSIDPENFHQKVLNSNQNVWNEDILHGLLKQHGYSGVKWSMNPKTHVVQLYHPQSVHEEHILKSEVLTKAETEETNTLMNRIEDKYFLPRKNLEKLTSELRERLKGGDGDTFVRHNVNQSIYFDSQDMDIFRDAMDKILPRFKLRIRRYAPSGELWENTAYLELKMKTRDGMTKKVRIRIPASVIPDLEKGKTIKDTTDLEKLNDDIPKDVFWKRFGAINGIISKFGVKKQIKIVYSRRAYSNDKIRVTIDEDIRYLEARAMSPRIERLLTDSPRWKKMKKKHLKVADKDYLVLEVKHQENVPKWLKDLLKDCDAKPVNFSKYCASIVAFLKNDKQSKGAITREHKVDTDSILADVAGYETIEKSENNLLKNDSHIKNIASHYAKLNNINLSHNYNVNLNPEHGSNIANAYEKLQHQPDNPDVQAAYGALIGETGKQFKHLINSGLKISRIQPGQENPYKTSKDMLNDLHNNNHIWYYPTEQGFGANEQSKNHPMLKETEFKHNGTPLLANDIFRIVHDAFGHGLTNSTFGPKGEHASYLAHKEMFSPLAQKALATETMGQNNWVNWSQKAGEHNRKNPSQTIYAEQKAGLLPENIISGKWHE